jgi:hypothetical protein
MFCTYCQVVFLGLYSAVGNKSAQKIYWIALTALGVSVLRGKSHGEWLTALAAFRAVRAICSLLAPQGKIFAFRCRYAETGTQIVSCFCFCELTILNVLHLCFIVNPNISFVLSCHTLSMMSQSPLNRWFELYTAFVRIAPICRWHHLSLSFILSIALE